MLRQLISTVAFGSLACGSPVENDFFSQSPTPLVPSSPGGQDGGGTGGQGTNTGGLFPSGGQPTAGGETGSGGVSGSGGEPTTGGQASGGTGGNPPTSRCGNGNIDPGEQCDDGNQASGDGCNKQCKLACDDFDDAIDFKRPDGRTHCYWNGGEVTWDEAKAGCEDQGGHLVTITSPQENAFIRDTMAEGTTWLGATDGKAPTEVGAGTYKWVTGEPFLYTNWNLPIEPDANCHDCDGSRCCDHCAALVENTKHWHDRRCSTQEVQYDYVCEYSAPGY